MVIKLDVRKSLQGLRICGGQTLSLANSVDYWRHFCLFMDSRDGGALVTL